MCLMNRYSNWWCLCTYVIGKWWVRRPKLVSEIVQILRSSLAFLRRCHFCPIWGVLCKDFHPEYCRSSCCCCCCSSTKLFFLWTIFLLDVRCTLDCKTNCHYLDTYPLRKIFYKLYYISSRCTLKSVGILGDIDWYMTSEGGIVNE